MSDVLGWILSEKAEREKEGLSCEYLLLSNIAIASISKKFGNIKEGGYLFGMMIKYDFDRPLFGIE